MTCLAKIFGIAVLLFSFVMPLAASAAATNEPVCVTATRANLRKGPGAQFPITWTVGQHMPLMRTQTKGPWSEVKDLDGETHWILSSAVTMKMSCAVVKAASVSLFKGPGKQFGLAEIAQADRYTAFRKVDRDGKYLLVQDERKGEYWVQEDKVWTPVIRHQVTF